MNPSMTPEPQTEPLRLDELAAKRARLDVIYRTYANDGSRAAEAVREAALLGIVIHDDAARSQLPDGAAGLREAIEALPFFPDGDGPRHGNAAGFRDYRRRVLAAIAALRAAGSLAPIPEPDTALREAAQNTIDALSVWHSDDERREVLDELRAALAPDTAGDER